MPAVLGFMTAFQKYIFDDDGTPVAHADQSRGHFFDGKEHPPGLRRELFSLYHPVRSHLEMIIGTVSPNSDDNRGVFQPQACGYADDFAVAAPSFRLLMPAISDAWNNSAVSPVHPQSQEL